MGNLAETHPLWEKEMQIRRSYVAVSLAILSMLAVASSALRPFATKPEITVVPYKANGIYRLSDKVGWTISASEPGSAAVPYSIKTNNQDVVQSGNLDLSSGHAIVEIALKEPAMLYLEIKPPSDRPLVFGAAVEPTGLKPVAPRPKDFDAFWKSKIAGLEAVPENPVLTPGDSYKPEVEYATIQMDHVNGEHVYGQLAKPKGAAKYPAVLVLQWASPPYPLQKPWVVELAAKGWLALNIEPHDVLPTEQPAYYQGLPAALKSYQSIGQDDRDKSYFVDMYLRDYRAVDYLTHRPDWDGKTIVVMGTSMGGQQSLCVAGLHPRITHLIVEEPAGCDLNAALHGRQEGYPFFPASDQKVMETARYVDAVNFAPHIKATCLVAMGFVDTIAPPAGIWTAFNQIRGPKEAAPMVDAPHNNTATAEQQRPYTDRASEWLDSLVRTGSVEVRKP